MKTAIRYSLAAWVIFGLIIIWIIYPMSNVYTASIRVSSLIIPQMILFYLNLIYLSPKFLDHNKKVAYYGSVGILLLAYTFGGGYLDIKLDEAFPLSIHHFDERPTHIVFLGRMMSAVPPLVISALIGRSILLRKRNEESLELRNKMLEAETKALKAQINPHFLFNSLNNIYSLAQMKSDKTPDAVLQLSEILRYITYDGNQNKVSLDNEIKVIENFIQLQKLKDDNFDNVQVAIEIRQNDLKIAPLLLIPFIENSFKHSNFEDKDNGWVDISIRTEGNVLIMKCSNSSGLTTGDKKDQTGGVGMENVKKRLNLLYPDRHELVIKMDKERYEVDLRIVL